VRFVLGEDADVYSGLARLLEWVRRRRETDVIEETGCCPFRAELVRTVCATCSMLGRLAVLAHVYGLT